MELKRCRMGRKSSAVQLLIVPYGIETGIVRITFQTGIDLLIVPYGIETIVYIGKLRRANSFNRTLWN